MSSNFDIIGMPFGSPLITHPPQDCAGRTCCVHNPSEHKMRTWPQNWRADRRLMERICEHGIGHPDPDDLAFKRLRFGPEYSWGEGIHGCDGCCSER